MASSEEVKQQPETPDDQAAFVLVSSSLIEVASGKSRPDGPPKAIVIQRVSFID